MNIFTEQGRGPVERTDHVLRDYIKIQTCSGEMDLRRRHLAVAVGLGCYSYCLCVCGCVPTPQKHTRHMYVLPGAGSRGLYRCCPDHAWHCARTLSLVFGAVPGDASARGADSHPGRMWDYNQPERSRCVALSRQPYRITLAVAMM